MIIKYTCSEGYSHTIASIRSSIELNHIIEEARKQGAKEIHNPETGEIFDLNQ